MDYSKYISEIKRLEENLRLEGQSGSFDPFRDFDKKMESLLVQFGKEFSKENVNKNNMLKITIRGTKDSSFEGTVLCFDPLTKEEHLIVSYDYQTRAEVVDNLRTLVKEEYNLDLYDYELCIVHEDK